MCINHNPCHIWLDTRIKKAERKLEKLQKKFDDGEIEDYELDSAQGKLDALIWIRNLLDNPKSL